MNPFISCLFLFINIKYIISFSYEYIIQSVNNKYPRIKELPSGEFFILMNNGIYTSNKNFSIISKIYAFNSEQSINSNEDNNKTALSEFKNGNDLYILSLVKGFLYFYDFKNRNITQYDLRDQLKGNFYDLIPYQIVNNCLHYVIIFTEIVEECIIFTEDKYIFNFYNYKIDFSLEENNNIKIKYFTYENFIKDLFSCYSFISSSIVSCQIIRNNYIMCFYLSDSSKIIRILKFEIDNDFNKDNAFDDYYYSNEEKIKDIKSGSSSETNNLFICFDYDYEYCTGSWPNKKCRNIIKSKCLIFDIKNKKFKQIITTQDMNNIEIFYFSETQNFILVTNDYINYFKIYKIDENSFSSINYDAEYFQECKIINSYTLLYNQSINGYNLISDCVDRNNNNWNVVYNISMFTVFSPIITPPTELLLENNYFEEEFYMYEEEEQKYIEDNEEEESNMEKENEEESYMMEENEEEESKMEKENEEESYMMEENEEEKSNVAKENEEESYVIEENEEVESNIVKENEEESYMIEENEEVDSYMEKENKEESYVIEENEEEKSNVAKQNEEESYVIEENEEVESNMEKGNEEESHVIEENEEKESKIWKKKMRKNHM